MSVLCLRQAQPTDAGSVGGLITAAVAAHDWKPKLHSAAEDIAHAGQLIDRGWVVVAEDVTGAVLGFLAQEAHYIHALFIASTAQGQGVGAALLDHAKARADRLELWTFQNNRGAQRFYKRAGFREVERTNGQTNEENLPDIHYLWEKPA